MVPDFLSRTAAGIIVSVLLFSEREFNADVDEVRRMGFQFGMGNSSWIHSGYDSNFYNKIGHAILTQRQQTAFKIFRDAGYAPAGAAAIVGSLSGESGINLDSTLNRAHPDASGGHHARHDKSGGIAEWLNATHGHGRKANLIAFASKLNKPVEDLETQCLFVIHELEHGDSGGNPNQYRSLNRDLRSGTKPVSMLTHDFTKHYERPNMAVSHVISFRVPQAKIVLRDAKILAASAPLKGDQQAKLSPTTTVTPGA